MSLSYLSYVFDIFHDTFWRSGLGDWIDRISSTTCSSTGISSVLDVQRIRPPPPMFSPASKTLGYSHGLILTRPSTCPCVFLPSIPGVFPQPVPHDRDGIICLSCDFRLFLDLSFVESLLLTVFFLTPRT